MDQHLSCSIGNKLCYAHNKAYYNSGYNKGYSIGSSNSSTVSSTPRFVYFTHISSGSSDSYTLTEDYSHMVIITSDSRVGRSQMKINGITADITETTISSTAEHCGYITINQSLHIGDVIKITPTGGTSNNMYWFMVY